MATKPIVQPEIWAQNALYTTGPFIGMSSKMVPPALIAAEGHRPGAANPTPAEYENSQQNRITSLCQWVFSGSSAGAADAHIVETNSTGRPTVHGATIDDSADEAALVVIGSGVTGAAVDVTNTAGGDGVVVALGGSTGSAFSSILTTNSVGLELEQSDSAASILITAHGSATSSCITILQGGVGRGIDVQGGAGNTAIEATAGAGQIAGDFIASATTLHALRAIGGTLRAIYGVGMGTGRGGEFLAGATGPEAVLATGSGASGRGVYGRTAAGAGLGSVGVLGEGRGTAAVGVSALSLEGPALLLTGDQTSPLYPEIKFTGQTPDPTLAIGGAYRSSSMNQLRHSADGVIFRSLVHLGTSNTSAMLVKNTLTGPITSNAAVADWKTLFDTECLITQGEGFSGLASGAEIIVSIVMDVRPDSAAIGSLGLRVLDMSNGGAAIYTRNGVGSAATAGFYLATALMEWQRAIAVEFRYAVPADGDLLLRLQMTKGTATNVVVRDIGVTVSGTWVP